MKRWQVALLIIMGVIITPWGINWVVLRPALFPVVGNNTDWLGFYGSFSGALVGASALIWITNKQIQSSREIMNKQLEASNYNLLMERKMQIEQNNMDNLLLSLMRVKTSTRQLDLFVRRSILSIADAIDMKESITVDEMQMNASAVLSELENVNQSLIKLSTSLVLSSIILSEKKGIKKDINNFVELTRASKEILRKISLRLIDLSRGTMGSNNTPISDKEWDVIKTHFLSMGDIYNNNFIEKYNSGSKQLNSIFIELLNNTYDMLFNAILDIDEFKIVKEIDFENVSSIVDEVELYYIGKNRT